MIEAVWHMENAIMEKRIERCEDDIKKLSEGIVETKVNTGNIQKIVDDFSDYIKRSIETLTKIDARLSNLDSAQQRFEKKLCEIEDKVDENEESHKVDTRPIMKNIVKKIIAGVVMAGLGIGLLISLLS